MNKIYALSVAVFFLSGCATNLANFKKSDFSGVKENKTQIALVRSDIPLTYQTFPETIKSFVKANLQETIDNECIEKQQKISPDLVPVLSAVGKLLFDLYHDNQTKKAEDLQKAAQFSYSGRIISETGDLKNYKCALIFRYSPLKIDKEEVNTLGLIALVKMDKHNQTAITISPRYIKANNTAAIAKKGDKQSIENINVSIAASIKAVGKQQTGLYGLFPVGEGVVSVPKIQLGPNGAPYTCSEKSSGVQNEKTCPTSDLIAFPPAGSPMSLSFAVSEIGDTGIGFDQTIAELKTVKEALGPALKETIGEYLKE